MLQIIIGTVIAFLSLAGILELGRCVLEFFYSQPQDKITLIIHSRGHDGRIEYLLRSMIFKSRGEGLKALPVIIVVDDGMDEETRAICRKLSEEYGYIHICGKHDLPVLLDPEDGLAR